MKKNPFSFHIQRPVLTLCTVVDWSQLHLHWSCQTNSGSVSCMYFSICPFSIASPFTGSWKGLEPIPAALQLPGIGEAADKQAFMLIFTPKVILIYQCPKWTWEQKRLWPPGLWNPEPSCCEVDRANHCFSLGYILCSVLMADHLAFYVAVQLILSSNWHHRCNYMYFSKP